VVPAAGNLVDAPVFGEPAIGLPTDPCRANPDAVHDGSTKLMSGRQDESLLFIRWCVTRANGYAGLTSRNLLCAQKSGSTGIYQLKVTLLVHEPTIWRRLLVPADVTLASCTTVSCNSLRWVGRRPHARISLAAAFGRPILKTGSWGYPLWKTNARCVSPAYSEGRLKAIYRYDFGDSWEHSIVLESGFQFDPIHYPIARMVSSRVTGRLWRHSRIL